MRTQPSDWRTLRESATSLLGLVIDALLLLIGLTSAKSIRLEEHFLRRVVVVETAGGVEGCRTESVDGDRPDKE